MGLHAHPSSAHMPLVYAVGLLIVVVLERVLHALAWLGVSLVMRPIVVERGSMMSVCHSVLSGSFDMGVDFVRVWVAATSGFAQWFLHYVPVLLIFFFFVWVMSLVSSQHAAFVHDVLFMWNNGLSAVMRSSVIVPLQVINLLFQVMVPFWNALVYFTKGMLHVMLLPMIHLNIDPVTKCIAAASSVIRALALSGTSFMSSLSACTDVGCLSIGARVFDVLSPMVHVRVMVSYMLMFAGESCTLVKPVLDVIAYPLLDSNFAQALHAGINAVLYTVVQLPLVTYARCMQAADDDDAYMRSLACTPDVTPVFNLAAAAARYAGILTDNWTDITWITVLAAFGKAPAACQPSPASLKNLADQLLFGGNETRLVGLGGTAYALTDGNSVQYTFFRGAPEQVVSQTNPN